MDWCGDAFPPPHHPGAVHFFFFLMLHDYGFWLGDDFGYVRPIYGTINGIEYKGSDLLTRALKKVYDTDWKNFLPHRLSVILHRGLRYEFFLDDKGPIPLFDFMQRLHTTRKYGSWFVFRKTLPDDILRRANEAKEPLRSFLEQIKKVPGYDQDPLEKRNMLLAMALANRPERFLRVADSRNWRPIIDYHLMRLALRVGLVELSRQEIAKNVQRASGGDEAERDIRLKVCEALRMVMEKSGRSLMELDETMWMARKYCPEMSEPDCPRCIFNPVCEKLTERFQPVFRTTAY